MKPITTLKANCKDCHRCVRSCPVKAIGIEKESARLIDEKCILCGKCVVECPQKAKQVVSNLTQVEQALQQKRKVILSLAPSFISVFSEYTWAELREKIAELGFAAVEETATGASIIAEHYRNFLQSSAKPLISACCPVIVNLITRYYPTLTTNLAGVVSPMIAHGRIIKSTYGNEAFVVFAGPCIAKIEEASQDRDSIDAVITFQELQQLLGSNRLPSCQTAAENIIGAEAYRARYFPIPGGIVKSFLRDAETDENFVYVDGINECIEVFEGMMRGEIHPTFVEALACSGGCIGGPVSASRQCMAARNRKVAEFAKWATCVQGPDLAICYDKTHTAMPVVTLQPTEAEIVAILHKTGKYSREDEKNCGACGYSSCREKAIAVYQGIAETEMCVPYMRTKAESFANIIVDHSLNGIIVVDQNMVVLEFNPTAQRMFNTRIDLIKGRSLAQIMDCSDFMYSLSTGEKITGKRVEYPHLHLVTEQMIIPVREHGLVIAIVTDVTAEEKRAQELQQMKMETAEKATEIIKKQMHVAQEIAGLLGETTAETKSALLELIWLLKDKEDR